ncbi:MAG TPA: retropepsin-like aspartic protease [Phycisphaerales bacterium]|nr:retropepsin-like aspartic protease [Phycisphaerales bacterium]
MRATPRLACAVVVCGLLCGAGCVSVQRSPIDRLPTELRDRVHLESRDDGGARLVVRQRLSVEPATPGQESPSFRQCSCSLRFYHPVHVPGFVEEPGTGRRHSVEFLIDTGGDFLVHLDRHDARRLRPWVSAEADPTRAVDVLGTSQAHAGVFAELQVGPLSLRPASVVVADSGARVPPLLGLRFIENCLRGVVIDHRISRCTLLLPTDPGDPPLEPPSGWVSIPWEPYTSPDVPESEGRVNTMRTIPVRVGGSEYRAVLDTASPIGVFAFVDLPAEGPAVTETIWAAGRRGRAITRTLAEPLHVGPLRLDGVLVTRAANADNARRSPDLIIGLATLGDVPVWFDPVANEVRLWMERGPARLPAPAPREAKAGPAHAVAQVAADYASREQIPEERLESLRTAVAAAFEALLGEPDAMVRYQRESGATLDSTMLRGWIRQMHDWQMMATVASDGADDLALYRESVRALEGRFAGIEKVFVERVRVGTRLDFEYNSEEWPFNAHRAQACVWHPADGPLMFAEGEAIKDGASGRTLHVAVPVRFRHGGYGRLRVNFYWDEAGEYWVPHMAILAADERGDIWPFLFF